MHGSSDEHAPAARRRPPRRLRVALYSHDAQGLDHVRRNLAIAAALAESELAPDVLLLTDALPTRAFDLPPRADWLTLPQLRAAADGSRSGRLEPEILLDVRAEAIAGALDAFDPDLLIVDELAQGVFGELRPALRRRRRSGGRTVLGVRDVLNAPTTAMFQWQQAGASEAIAEHYDAVWIYGDRRVYDPVKEYSLPAAVVAKAHFTGYLAPPMHRPLRPGSHLILCLLGDGDDGYELGRAFLRADLPPGAMAVLVTGPRMSAGDREHLERVAAQRGDREVRQVVPNTLDLLAQAHAVVATGSYHAVCEVLASGVPALIVPESSRQEESIRAQRLQALGVLDHCPLGELTAARIGTWTAKAVDRPQRAGAVIFTHGLGTVVHLAAELCGTALPEVGRAAS